jgi:WD40 repeat protein
MLAHKRNTLLAALTLLGAGLDLDQALANPPGAADRVATLLAAPQAQPAARFPGGDTPAPIKIEYHGWFSNPVFSPDSKTLVYAQMAALPYGAKTAPTHFIVWNVTTGKQSQQIAGPADDSLVGSLALAPDGKHAALCLWNTAVRLWDLPAGKETGRVEKSQGAMQLRFTPDGGTLGWLRDGDIYLADAATAQQLRHFGKDGDSPVTTFAFVDGGKTVIGGHASSKVAVPGGKNPTVEYQITFWAYEAATGKKLHQVGATATDLRKKFAGPPPHYVFVTDGGKSVVLATARGNLQVCDAITGKKDRDIPVPRKDQAESVRQLALSTNGQIIAMMTTGGVITVWDLAAGKQLHQLTIGQSLDHFALAPDGKTLAVTHQTPGKVGAVLLIYAL